MSQHDLRLPRVHVEGARPRVAREIERALPDVNEPRRREPRYERREVVRVEVLLPEDEPLLPEDVVDLVERGLDPGRRIAVGVVGNEPVPDGLVVEDRKSTRLN